MIKKVLQVSALATLLSTSLAVAATDKVSICHATGSDKNPYHLITVSANGLNGHDGHQDDFFPEEGVESCAPDQFPS